ncbi:MAG: hypothetical protein A2201_02230 [Alicyclobacillus sp. RIFOXYA1_FULL_53_8]|nr:MAG: hypothetical protein A2201_02230 [Alicyclobacillus sp. RIFOXYA1_FULL_53_8]
MIGVCYGAVADGLDATIVKVEADVGRGLPQFSIVGLPDSAVTESRLRIRSAIQNAGLEFPRGRITVNLSPASVRKHGAGLDLAIAIAILRSTGWVPNVIDRVVGFCAELSLSGDLVQVPGILNLALAFQKHHIVQAVVAIPQQSDLIPLPNFTWVPFHSLGKVAEFLRDPATTIPEVVVQGIEPAFLELEDEGDFSEVAGMEQVKRALTIAAAGRHHILLIGPPGCGKTMISERFPSIMPRLSSMEALEVYAIHQASGIARQPSLTPPFRMPHHTLTTAGLIGGGAPVTAGEVTLAHRGVLVLDELLEFQRTTLDALREPLVSKQLRMTRGGRSAILPADFILVGTLNPCPCGQRGFADCRCTDSIVTRYWSRLSGPFLDRVDLVVHVHPNRTRQNASERGESSASRVIRRRVEAARLALANPDSASPLGHEMERRPLVMNRAARELLQRAGTGLQLSRRAMLSITRVAQTIGALDEQEEIRSEQIEEALALRSHIQLS